MNDNSFTCYITANIQDRSVVLILLLEIIDLACISDLFFLSLFLYFSDMDGVQVELTPLTVKQRIGSVVHFTCRYQGSELMEIEFQEIRTPRNNLYAQNYLLGEAFHTSLRQYKMSAEQSIDIVITPELRAVKCRIKNLDGLEVAMVMSHITKGLIYAFRLCFCVMVDFGADFMYQSVSAFLGSWASVVVCFTDEAVASSLADPYSSFSMSHAVFFPL